MDQDADTVYLNLRVTTNLHTGEVMHIALHNAVCYMVIKRFQKRILIQRIYFLCAYYMDKVRAACLQLPNLMECNKQILR